MSSKTYKVIQSVPVPDAVDMREYKLRGWCAFENYISEWITPSDRILDMKFVKERMEEWRCKTLTEMSAKYIEKGADQEVASWSGMFDGFVKTGKNVLEKYQIVVNLTNHPSRSKEPMTPNKFEELFHDDPSSSLQVTNGSDIDLLKEKFAKGYKELFSSGIATYDFSGLGWKFDIRVLFDTIFKDGAGQIVKLELCDNDLFGDISLFDRLPRLESLNIEGCSDLDGDISVFQRLRNLQYLNVHGCSKLNGDHDSLRTALPKCHFHF